MSLVDTERATYEQMWALDAYSDNSPGEKLAAMFDAIVKEMREDASPTRRPFLSTPTVLDAGCGSAKGALALDALGYRVTLCDLTDSGVSPEAQWMPFVEVALWDDLISKVGTHDFVYCCDVMEHVPPTFAMLVVQRLLDVTRHAVFFNISLVQDSFGMWVGKPLHQNVQTFMQWRDQLATLGEVLEARDCLTSGIFLVAPKR